MTFSIDDQGLLHGDRVEQRLISGKNSGNFEPGQLDMIVMHYTAGTTLEGAVSHLAKPHVQASAHLVVGRDGSIVQMVPFTKKAWHAGRSEYANRQGINQYSIGIEMVNAGPLQKSGDGFVSQYGGRFEENDVIQAVHRNESGARYWHTYTEAQIMCAFELCGALVNTYNMKYIVGHEEIAPQRKSDPGPAFPLETLRDQLLLSRSDNAPLAPDLNLAPAATKQARVSASKLNIRELPSLNAKAIRDPLPNGTRVTILKQENGWAKVRVEQEGWVKQDFLES
ncbi:N-acetylmuramoyl-L-alanine amidase [Ketobacter alkanivorans]|uniref:N-acetylmuramoyl-L-alanine amidase n=1 Tax=Ketobacter alkanivorans TaxID=1917421 RepID=A0A2K9LMQ3_9GAMM|nr:N-acetylmuramoyl-L-alanine amidase [Ketobacter alkanivorans]AUM13572.1 hypothetical protein Kalk_14580 [Ketobacter alkanivorans]